MHSMLDYLGHLEWYLGDKYGVALAITALVIEVFLVLYGKKQSLEHLWLYIGAQWLCMVLPIAFFLSRILHMDEVQEQLLYHFLPAGLVGAIALTIWYKKASGKFGQKIMVAFVLGLILLIGQPWTYRMENLRASKLDAEVVEVARALGPGTAVLPEEIGLQLHKVQQETQMVFEEGYWYSYEDVTEFNIESVFPYILNNPVHYVVLPKADYNQSYMDLVSYTKLIETEHYDVYINPNY